MPTYLNTTVQGGYNGGAVVTAKVAGTTVFTATGNSPYNLEYTNTTATFNSPVGEITLTLTPPPTSTSALVITYSGAISETLSIMPDGSNTSYGYSYSNMILLEGEPFVWDPDSPLYKLWFTDGTFITLVNELDPAVYDGSINVSTNHLMFYPVSGDPSSVTKTDYEGNTWIIANNGVTINGTEYTISGTRSYLGYNPSTKKLYQSSLNPVPGSNNNFYGGDVTGTGFTTLDELVAYAEGVYELSGTTYTINNILPNSEFPVKTLEIYAGRNSATSYDKLFAKTGGSSIEQSLDLNNSITNYDVEPEEGEDPFTPGGTTGDDETDPEGGDGTFENEEITVDPPALPSLSAITSGFIAAYMPTFAQLQSLGDYLWSDLFSLDTFKKLFNDPMQAILGLSLVPVTPSTNDGYVVIGNVNTNIIMPRVMQQFVTVDCGSITIPEYWGGYLDYSPYTKVEIYLPYIGVRPLDTDEVMGKTLHVVYHVDVLSGACVCFIQCDNTIRYHYVGQCGASIPITANDWTRVVNGAVSIATALGVGVATLGAGAAAAGGITATSMAGAGALVGGIASQVLASKPRVEHSGSLAGMGGILGVQFPYIMIQRPRQAVPSGQNAFTGYPSFIKRTLSTVTGYTQVTGVHLTGLSCTDEEKKEIQAYLEAGVIL